MENKILAFIKKYWLVIVVVILIIVACVCTWNYFHPAATADQPSAPVYETYPESHIADGIDKAAEKSGVHLDLGQQKEVLQAI